MLLNIIIFVFTIAYFKALFEHYISIYMALPGLDITLLHI